MHAHLLCLFLIASTLGLHHSNHGSFKGKLSPSISNLRESMSKKLNQLKHATAERLLNPHFALMGTPNLSNLSSLANLTNGTNTTAIGADNSGESLWDKFVNGVKGICGGNSS
jgi:hypothetical protein